MSKFEHLLFAPENGSGISPVRVEGLAQAIRKAGGQARVLPNSFASNYPQDMFIIIGSYAFYPSLDGEMDYKRSAFRGWVENDYSLCALDELPSLEYDGGNFIAHDERRLFLAGCYQKYANDKNQFRSIVREMRNVSGYNGIIIDCTSLHLDCCIGLMPNGQYLVKIDEMANSPDEDNFLIMGGVTDYGLDVLSGHLGRENIVAYSFLAHPDSDVILGAGLLDDPATAKPLSMLTNFTTVGDKIIGEAFPPELKHIVHNRGMGVISPNDVGLKTFLADMHGFVGGAHCSTLKRWRLDETCLRPRHETAQGQRRCYDAT